MEFLTTFPTLEALQRAQPQLRALLFDMDGTLFQTEEIHGEALRHMARDWGLRPPFAPHEVEARLKGMSDRQVMELARDWPGFPPHMNAELFVAEKNSRLVELIPQAPMHKWISPELVKLIQDAKSAGLMCAVVTSSERIITDILLHLSGLDRVLDLVITLQDVKKPKPHPWPYLQAMLQLGVGPRETVIFEDSPPGLAAATAAGARVIRADWWMNSANPLE